VVYRIEGEQEGNVLFPPGGKKPPRKKDLSMPAKGKKKNLRKKKGGALE